MASQEPIEGAASSRRLSQALYTEATWTPLPRVSLVPGMRLDYLSLGEFEGWVFDPRITSKVELVKKKLSLTAAVRPGGDLYLIDFVRIEGQSSEWVLSHVRAGQEVFRQEVEAAGFEFVAEKE